MNRSTRLDFSAACVCAVVLSATSLIAKETPAGTQAPAAISDEMPDLKLAEAEAALASIEEDPRLEAAVKDLLRSKYSQTIDALKEAAEFAASAAEYREAVGTGSERAAELRDQLKDLPPPENAASTVATDSPEDLQKKVESRQADLNRLREDLSKIAGDLTRVKVRPVEVSARFPKAQRELSDIQQRLQAPEFTEDATSPGRVADRILLEARESRLRNELEMLQQERLSQSVREGLLQAQHDLLARRVEDAETALNALQSLLQQHRASEVDRVKSLADKLERDLSVGDEAAQGLVTEVQALTGEFERVVEGLKKVRAAQDDIATRHRELTEEFESIREHLNSGGGGRAMAQALFDLQSRVFGARAAQRKVQLPDLDEMRLASFEVRQKLRKHSGVEQEFADQSENVVQRIVAARKELLEKLEASYGDLIRDMDLLEGESTQYLDKAEEIDAYISQQFFGFGIKSCPSISVKSVTDLPGGLHWVFGGDHWSELGGALRWMASHMPRRTFSVILVVIVLLLMRHRIVAALEATGRSVGQVSTDRYAYTVEALVWSSLLAAPIPILVGFAAWGLRQTPAPSDWMWGVAHGLWLAVLVTVKTEFLSAVCRRGGLGAAHFGWRQETLTQFRSAIKWFTIVYVPALLLVASCTFGDGSQYFDSIGRVSFMLGNVWTMIVLWRLFCGPDGLLSTLTRGHPDRLLTRYRYLWLSLLFACPLALVVIASFGYLITAVEFSIGLIATVGRIAGGAILYALTLRWFTLNQHKLESTETLGAEREQQEASPRLEHQEEPHEISSAVKGAAEQRDLEAISERTRATLQLLFGLGVAFSIIVFWSETFPLIEVMETTPIPLTGGRSLLTLTQAVLVLVVTCLLTRSLPGLLEVSVLRVATTDAGTRTAVTTLFQYAVLAVGLFAFLNVLHVDWAKFGWIAAALSVGLGFGLQEVVANFVCGLILMFERPIRVGDVVTVENTTGTITKIHIRATTITNWDDQEFVVPNKTLITNTLLNWTLTAPRNRIVIPVGVAYGSDTEKARQIMLNLAAEHPLVLDDPAPVATFEEFADSSLTLILRAYLPNLDNRLKTITELHTEIDKRFAEAGIEIAFPQRDLHFRNGWGSKCQQSSNGTEAGSSETEVS